KPNDYKLQNLKTRGTASGQNETILYISRIDGVLVRASENAEQSMDATVALANDSNQLHYILDAKGHSEIVLIPDSSPDARKSHFLFHISHSSVSLGTQNSGARYNEGLRTELWSGRSSHSCPAICNVHIRRDAISQ